jgi:RNA 3'-phosphate cyclase
MIEIDGKIGGGQVLRTVIGLSSLIQEPVKITNIRQNRPGVEQGLRPQHMMGVKIAGEFCDAEIEGLKEGSTTIEFTPQKLHSVSGEIDIGTAGSVTLLIQTLLPILIFSKKTISLKIKGGTEVKWAPHVQYYQNVAIPLINKLGSNIQMEVIKHGYYPKGGGLVRIESKPTKKLRAWVCENRGDIKSLHVESVAGNLPREIAQRQGDTALRLLRFKYHNNKSSMVFKSAESISPGTSCTCYAICENSILGASSLGERGLKAEIVGQEAYEELEKSLETGACLDKYMADQILPFIALAEGNSNVSIEGATDHLVTNIKVIEKVLPVKFKAEKRNISISGIGWE